MGWDGPLTNRQFKVWQAWLLDEYNRPSRTDLYLMQIAAVIRQVNCRSVAEAQRVRLKDFHLTLREPGPKLTTEQATRYAKARWSAAVGIIPPGKTADGNPRDNSESGVE